MAAIVSSMEEGVEAVHKGQEVISATGQSMHMVTERIAAVTDKIREIAAILGQQKEASAEISSGIAGIAAMSGENVKTISSIIDTMDKADAIITGAVGELSKLEIKDFTINVAKSDHVIWRKRLAQMLVGQLALKANELADHHQCRLGKWYDNVTDPKIRDHPAYKALIAPHAEVHAQGIQATRCYEKGDLDGAIAHIHKVSEASKRRSQPVGHPG